MVDARLTHIGSDGYVDRGATDLKSYMLQGAYYGNRTSVKLLSFGGKAKTYLIYTGVTKEEMELYGPRYHTEGQYETSSGPYVLADGTHVDYYDDHTDNYLQINNQLIVNHQISDNWNLSAMGFYTYGYGYYNQYKAERTLVEYMNLGISDYNVEADMVRSKIMRNHTAGVSASVGYSAERLSLLMGGFYSFYTCPHWGELNWVDGFAPRLVERRTASPFARTRAYGTRTGEPQSRCGKLYRFVRYQKESSYDQSFARSNSSRRYLVRSQDADKSSSHHRQYYPSQWRT